MGTGPTNQVKMIALITPYKSQFDQWVSDFGREDEQYIFVSKIDDVRGRYFAAIQKGFTFYRVHPDVVEAAKQRIR